MKLTFFDNSARTSLKIFFRKILVMINSNDCMLRDSSGQASVKYNSIGKHLERSKLKTTSSEA